MKLEERHAVRGITQYQHGGRANVRGVNNACAI
jgi:hypothetical protein